nr:hypothetical protein [uncultured Dyadobacter sp.]
MMRALSLYFFVMFAALLSGCKKDPEILPGVIEVRDNYLKSIRVNGAKEATLDTTRNYIQVVLPADYTSDVLDLALELGNGMVLATPMDSTLAADNHVRYRFAGVPPVIFAVGRPAGSAGYEKRYTIFVRHEGELTAKLTSLLHLSSDMSTYADTSDLHAYGSFRAVSGLGSIPEVPGGSNTVSFELKDLSTGQRATGSNSEVFPFELIVSPVSELMSSTQMRLTMRYGEKVFQFPDVAGFKRPGAWGKVYWYDKQWKNLTYDKRVTILGGVFLSDFQYQVTFSNDRMTNPRKINAKVRSYNQLFFDVPADLPEDQYVVSVYEDDKLIGLSTEAIAKDSLTMSVAGIWTEADECPIGRIVHGNIAKTSLKKGQTFYAMPFPGIAEPPRGKPVDTNKPLPDLQLKSNQGTILLKATAQADRCYADGSLYIYYGVYQVPANVASGRYEARFISDKGEASLAYWNLVEIQ